ncbi:AI-2E family transporter [Cytophagales bacterium LB-30]|uniref:AI-2E family transporter n=1 Tax=Shiella aurantiaca TaxID=3058365 RepID=A0ABT8F7U7_9BACT|nr:AI-2E family transporter [Shiella aurantiaca]MDN4166011.1 AI-2E family transporter [Shiella aurantiaca]
MSALAQKPFDQTLKVLLFTFLVVVFLYFASPLLVPLSVALLLSFILFPICRWLERHRFSRGMAILVGLGFISALLVGLVSLLFYQFTQFLHEWPTLNRKLQALMQQIEAYISTSSLNIFFAPGQGLSDSLIRYASEELFPLIPQVLYDSSVSFVMLFLIPIYVALILYNRENLVEFLYRIFPKSSAHYIKTLLPDVIVTYYNFIKGMLIVYLIMGILNSIGLAIIGIPNPIFFGFIASLLTFIPYVGITLGALLPMAVSWLKFDSLWYPGGVMLVFVIVQILEAYIIFPMAVSNRLKISTLITLIMIIAGGLLWGTLGMILFVPFTAIFKLIADQVEELKPIAILLDPGKVPNKKAAAPTQSEDV